MPTARRGTYKGPSALSKVRAMILVTGGAGFIGSNLVAALCERGQRVAVCDHLGCGDKWRNIAKRDLEDVIPPESLGDFLDSAAGRLDAVVHLGATSSTTATDGDASGLTSTDVGVKETGSTAAGDSAQLTGTGCAPGDFTWTVDEAASQDWVNDAQVFYCD